MDWSIVRGENASDESHKHIEIVTLCCAAMCQSNRCCMCYSWQHAVSTVLFANIARHLLTSIYTSFSDTVLDCFSRKYVCLLTLSCKYVITWKELKELYKYLKFVFKRPIFLNFDFK